MATPKRTWQLQRAKAEFSKVVDESIRHGPQVVTRHGRPAAVVMSVEEFERLKRAGPDFKQFLKKAPLYQLDLTRSADRGRKVRF